MNQLLVVLAAMPLASPANLAAAGDRALLGECRGTDTVLRLELTLDSAGRPTALSFDGQLAGAAIADSEPVTGYLYNYDVEPAERAGEATYVGFHVHLFDLGGELHRHLRLSHEDGGDAARIAASGHYSDDQHGAIELSCILRRPALDRLP